jgi:hypothetical protein
LKTVEQIEEDLGTLPFGPLADEQMDGISTLLGR